MLMIYLFDIIILILKYRKIPLITNTRNQLVQFHYFSVCLLSAQILMNFCLMCVTRDCACKKKKIISGDVWTETRKQWPTISFWRERVLEVVEDNSDEGNNWDATVFEWVFNERKINNKRSEFCKWSWTVAKHTYKEMRLPVHVVFCEHFVFNFVIISFV